MAINFNADATVYPDSAFFPVVDEADAIIASIPSFIGAWDAIDFVDYNTDWPSRLGSTNKIRCYTNYVPPVKGIVDGRNVANFATKSRAYVIDSSDVGVPMSGLTYAVRAKFTNAVANAQRLFMFSTGIFYARTTIGTPVWQWTWGGDTNTPIQTPVLGWHSLLFTKHSTDAAQLEHDGSDVVSFGSSGVSIPNDTLSLGDRSGNNTTAEHSLSRLILCGAGNISTLQKSAIKAWING